MSAPIWFQLAVKWHAKTSNDCPLSDFGTSLEALLWFAFQRLANREKKDGTLAFRVRRKEVNHVIVEEGQPGRTQALGIRGQVHPPADCARLQLDGPVAAVPISFQDAFQIGEKEDVHAGVRRQLLLQSKMVRLGAKYSSLQKLQGLLLTPKEVSTRLEPLYRMHDQVKVVQLRAWRLKKVSRKTARGAIENGRELVQRNSFSLIELSGRAAAQDHLLDRVLRLFFFRQSLEANCLACRGGRWEDLLLPAPLSHLLLRLQRRRIVHLKHGGILDLTLRKWDRLQSERRSLS